MQRIEWLALARLVPARARALAIRSIVRILELHPNWTSSFRTGLLILRFPAASDHVLMQAAGYPMARLERIDWSFKSNTNTSHGVFQVLSAVPEGLMLTGISVAAPDESRHSRSPTVDLNQ